MNKDDDAVGRPASAVAQFVHLAFHSQRIAMEYRLGEAHFVPAQVGHRGSQRRVADGDANHEPECEHAVDHALTEFAVCATVFFVQMQRRGIVGECREKHVVGFGHGPADRVAEFLSDNEFFKIKSRHRRPLQMSASTPAYGNAPVPGEAPIAIPIGVQLHHHIRMHARAALSLILALLPVASLRAQTVPAAAYPDPPQVLFKELFAAVQTQAIYGDSKTFADAIAQTAPADILAQYHASRPDSPAALKRFTDAHFSLPASAGSPASQATQVDIVGHIDALWATLTRTTATAPRYSSLLPLPQPYVVPGGRFREIYYWDSYFTMLGLAESGRHDLLAGMVQDFAYLIDTYGHVPNGARSYYLSRSQPPFFFEMVGLLSPDDPARAFSQYLPQLKREYAFWMAGAGQSGRGQGHRRVVVLPDGSRLNRYWDDRDTPRDEAYREDTELARTTRRPARQLFRDIRAAAESGWDFSSRWFADGRTRATIDTTEIVPVDLNSLLFGLEQAIRSGCRRRGDIACAHEFAQRAAARRAAVDHYLWNAANGCYFDYRWTRRAPLARLSAATVYPLFVSLASATQAAAVAKTVARDLLKPGGIVTTPTDTGEQWDAPNGWAPIQWMAIAGLRRYGQGSLALTIACRWIGNVENLYRQSGKLVEKYDVVTTGRSSGGGEYPLQDGFGWTNGVTRKLFDLYSAVPGNQCDADHTGLNSQF
jgi:alpha,alpha-trehalase